MSKLNHDVKLKGMKVLDVIMMCIPFGLCWFLYYAGLVYARFSWKGNLAILGLFVFLFICMGKVYDAFWMSGQRISELTYGQILAALTTDGVMYIVICLMSAKLCNLIPGLCCIGGQVAWQLPGLIFHISGITEHFHHSLLLLSMICIRVWKSLSTSMALKRNTMYR